MDNNKGQTIFLSVIGIATLLVAIIGATFAWFSISIQGSDDTDKSVVTKTVLGTVIFTDGDEVVLNSFKQGVNATYTKTFTVSNNTPNTTDDFPYKIYINVEDNSLSDVTEGQLVHFISGTKSGNGTVVDLTETTVPSQGKQLLGEGLLSGSETHTYTYTINFKNTDTQYNVIGKQFNAKIIIEK
ncbi:MAG: hypothetical protein GX758_01915 [Tenericutes bacterium]|nr:hypothetical protein [Mycoplasmatota bacterium]